MDEVRPAVTTQIDSSGLQPGEKLLVLQTVPGPAKGNIPALSGLAELSIESAPQSLIRQGRIRLVAFLSTVRDLFRKPVPTFRDHS
jgi:hypothetical protein